MNTKKLIIIFINALATAETLCRDCLRNTMNEFCYNVINQTQFKFNAKI